MKKGWIIWAYISCVSLTALIACQGKAKKEETAGIKADTAAVQQPAPSDLMFVTEWVGKYPNEVGLLEQPALTKRLESLLKGHYAAFTENWNTETPVTLTDSIVHTSGCKAHDCTALSYDLYIDLPEDNINIYAITDGKVSIFAEKDTIDLPKKLKDELRIVISNAQFKPVNRKETSPDSVRQKESE